MAAREILAKEQNPLTVSVTAIVCDTCAAPIPFNIYADLTHPIHWLALDSIRESLQPLCPSRFCRKMRKAERKAARS
jgi:hypothetical protein